jgi:predicted RNase H-like nuclease (RuvC/YqgF family)
MSEHKLKDAKQLLTTGAEENRTKRIERLIDDLRAEFDTLHRVCRILLDDLEHIETRLDQFATKEHCVEFVHKDACTRVDMDLTDKAKQLSELVSTIGRLEARIMQLETLLFKNAVPVVNITNTGAAIGHDVGGNVST